MNIGRKTGNLTGTKTKTLLVLGMLALSITSAFWILSAKPLDNHECLVAVTARETLENGNWIMPTFNNKPRLQKTPLSYWLVASAAVLTGRIDEFTARLPSALAAVLSVVAILFFVSRWLGFRTALLSAGVWITSVVYLRYAHNARPDMVMSFFITLCLLSFYSAVNEQNRRAQIRYMLLFWISFALANLAKGPAPIPLVLVPLFAYMLISRQWKKIPKLLPVAGTIIFLIIVLPWPLAIAHRVNWDLILWKHEFFDRFFGTYARGNYPIYYYVPVLVKFSAPWVAFLPMALAAPFFRVWRGKRPVMLYLWLWFTTDMLFLTIDAGKRQHYPLPLMPAVAILTGILLEDLAFIRKAHTLKQAKDILKGHVAAAALVAAGLPIYIAFFHRNLLAQAIALAATIAVMTITATVLFSKGRPGPACSTVFIGTTLMLLIIFAGFTVPLCRDEPFKQFSLTAAKMIPPSDKLVAYIHASPRFIFYTGKPIPEITDLSQLETLYNRNCWIVAHGDDIDKLHNKKGLEIAYIDKMAEPRRGFNIPAALLHKSTGKAGPPAGKTAGPDITAKVP